MQRFSRRQKQSQQGRGRTPARWTPLELLLVVMSLVMIAYPLYASTLSLVNPPSVPAQEAATAVPGDDETAPAEAPTEEEQESEVAQEPSEAPAQAPQQETKAPEEPSEAPTKAPEPAEETRAPAPTNAVQQEEASPTERVQEPAQRVTFTPDNSDATSTPQTVDPTNTSPVPPPSNTPPTQPTGQTQQPTNTSQSEPTSQTQQPTNTGQPQPPTNTVDPNVTARPTNTSFVPPDGEPLELIKIASASTVAPGEAFSFSLTVRTTSESTISVDVRDSVNSMLEVLGASTSSGSCSSGQTVTCNVSVSRDSSASIVIQVRARGDASGLVTNQASASSNGITAASSTVRVNIAGSTVPTSDPNVPTNTPQPVEPSATNDPNVPTNTPQPAEPSATPSSGGGDGGNGGGGGGGGSGGGGGGGSGGGGGGGGGGRSATEVPPPPPPPPVDDTTLLPAGEPSQASPTAVRVVPTARRVTPRPSNPGGSSGTASQPSASSASATPVLPTSAQQPSPTPPAAFLVASSDVFFRIASDWGSANPGQEVNYTIVLRNTQAEAAINDLLIRSTLPSNLVVLGASSDSGTDPQVTGNDVQLRLPSLQAGETVEITVRTRIKDGVARGTLIVTQAQASYTGLTQMLFSNVVTVLVVDAAPTSAATQVAQAATNTPAVALPTNTQQGLTATEDPQAYPPAETATAESAETEAPVEATAVMEATNTPTATNTLGTSQPTSVVEASPTASATAVPEQMAPLPDTSSTGVPIFGFALLGMTLFVRTLRIHRARERI